MPEGPSILILKEAVLPFKGKKITGVSGYGEADKRMLLNKKVTDFKTWGKHFLICTKDATVLIHLMLFGSYSVNKKKLNSEKKNRNPSLSLEFGNGEINFYTTKVSMLEGKPDDSYDWSADIMHDDWNAAAALKKLKANPGAFLCDALLDQHIFAGCGNIIKNEALFRSRLHPLNLAGVVPTPALKILIKEVRNYSFDFLEWKKQGVLKKHWEAYEKKICPRCAIPLASAVLGKTKRRNYFCENCQVLHSAIQPGPGSNDNSLVKPRKKIRRK